MSPAKTVAVAVAVADSSSSAIDMEMEALHGKPQPIAEAEEEDTVAAAATESAATAATAGGEASEEGSSSEEESSSEASGSDEDLDDEEDGNGEEEEQKEEDEQDEDEHAESPSGAAPKEEVAAVAAAGAAAGSCSPHLDASTDAQIVEASSQPKSADSDGAVPKDGAHEDATMQEHACAAEDVAGTGEVDGAAEGRFLTQTTDSAMAATGEEAGAEEAPTPPEAPTEEPMDAAAEQEATPEQEPAREGSHVAASEEDLAAAEAAAENEASAGEEASAGSSAAGCKAGGAVTDDEDGEMEDLMKSSGLDDAGGGSSEAAAAESEQQQTGDGEQGAHTADPVPQADAPAIRAPQAPKKAVHKPAMQQAPKAAHVLSQEPMPAAARKAAVPARKLAVPAASPSKAATSKAPMAGDLVQKATSPAGVPAQLKQPCQAPPTDAIAAALSETAGRPTPLPSIRQFDANVPRLKPGAVQPNSPTLPCIPRRRLARHADGSTKVHNLGNADKQYAKNVTYSPCPGGGQVFDWQETHRRNVQAAKEKANRKRQESVVEAARKALEYEEESDAAFNMWLAEKSMAQRVEKQRYALMTRLSAMSATYQSDINEQIAQRRERAWAHNFSALESGSPTFERPRPLRRRKGVDEVGVASAPEGGCSPARSLRMHMQ